MPLKAALDLVMRDLEYSGRLTIRWLPICESLRQPVIAYAEKHGLIINYGKTIEPTLKGLNYIKNQ